MQKKYFDDENKKYRYYIFDYLIGQHILTLDTVKNRERIDGFNIHGQCYSLDRDWNKVTKATIKRALNRNGYVFDSYIRKYFTEDNRYIGDNDKRLLYRSNNYDDCVLFLVKYGKENENCTNNTEFNYYEKYLEDKSKNLDNFKEETLVKRNIQYYSGKIVQEPISKEIKETNEKYFTIKIKDYYEKEVELAFRYSGNNEHKKFKIGNSLGVKVQKLDNGLNKVISVDWINECKLKVDRKTIKADRDFIKNLIDAGALDDVNELKTKEEYESAVDYWVQHYFDDYSDNEIKEEISNKDSIIVYEKNDNEEASM